MGEQEQTYKIRKFLEMEKLGLENDEDMMVPFIFYCTTCYRCQDNCPQDVEIVDAVLQIREDAVHKGKMLESHKRVAQMLIEHGHAVPNNSAGKEKRKKLGLNEMPPTVQGSDKGLKEVRTLLELTGFNKLVAGEQCKDTVNEAGVSVKNADYDNSIAEEST